MKINGVEVPKILEFGATILKKFTNVFRNADREMRKLFEYVAVECRIDKYGRAIPIKMRRKRGNEKIL